MWKMNARWLLLLAVVCMILAGNGCLFVDESRLSEDGHEEKPWNNPAPWEQRIPGL